MPPSPLPRSPRLRGIGGWGDASQSPALVILERVRVRLVERIRCPAGGETLVFPLVASVAQWQQVQLDRSVFIREVSGQGKVWPALHFVNVMNHGRFGVPANAGAPRALEMVFLKNLLAKRFPCPGLVELV